MDRADKARLFKSLHVKGDPLVLFNIWDAGSAKAVVAAGAKAVATGSWSVADAHGYADGEKLPLDLLVTVAGRIAATVDRPVSIDFEGGFAAEPDAVAANVARLLDVGVIGVNLEDRVMGGRGLRDIADQAARIAAIRAMAEARGVPFFVNARTDLFLQAEPGGHAALLEAAIERARAYRTAGGDGFFVPGLVDLDLIGRLCAAVEAPVNVMMSPSAPPLARLPERGVGRVSFGPMPYRQAMASLTERAARDTAWR